MKNAKTLEKRLDSLKLEGLGLKSEVVKQLDKKYSKTVENT